MNGVPPPEQLAEDTAAIVEFMLGQDGMAGKLLQQHADDGTGRCAVCSTGGQAGRHVWPCRIHGYARLALEAGKRRG